MKNEIITDPELTFRGLRNPKYLAAEDFIEQGIKEIVLTIEGVNTVDVYDHNTKDNKTVGVMYFYERHELEWLKPFIITAEANIKALIKVTGDYRPIDAINKVIKIGIESSKHSESGYAVRVKNIPSAELVKTFSHENVAEIKALLTAANKTEESICKAYGVSNLSKIPQSKFQAAKRKLEDLAAEAAKLVTEQTITTNNI